MAKGTYSGPVPENDPMFTGRYELFSTTSRPKERQQLDSGETENPVVHSTQYWVKIVEFLQQNWALVDEEPDRRARIYFVNDTSGIFDEIICATIQDAHAALFRNRFLEFSTCTDLQSFLRPPPGPFHRASHPNGLIYSSGRFWV